VSNRYWFAPLIPPGRPGRARMTPISWEGWAVAGGFAAAMLIGGAVFVVLMLLDRVVIAVIEYVSVAVIGAGLFMWAAYAKADPVKTSAEYRQMRRASQGNAT
jgi:hypothetical protein